ncbi:GEVED domain-containing protein [Niabella hibiscisoli]|uniref:GEVED domain-containing protein n=1 Tax=Niabella hibiscisoli TaxID=1825928 RepID=UPI001F0EB170|nr:GEVED domain-containing protein [Niabella hibiscisoli]MCH5721089.1 GEVED domain-containing protein [Niabella hibiscisoli]
MSVTVPPNTINNTYPLTWNTISTTAPVFARFRISSDVAAQNPSGIAVGGEVEDYKIPLGTVLAVNFGEITASFSNGELLVNWSTLKESNNSHFQVEVSADGKQFARVGEVKTQAENGNSSMSLNYSFSKTITANALQLGGGLMVLSMLILSLRRRRLRVVIVLMAALSLFLAGCMKKDSIDRAGERIFVRIVQVDQDGTRSYSKVIKAIMVNG